MSASPADRTPGRTPNGAGPQVMRRPKTADPLMRPNKKKRPPQPNLANGTVGGRPDGAAILARGPQQNMLHPLGKPRQPDVRSNKPPPLASVAGSGIATSAFTEPVKGSYTDIPLVTTKRELMEGLRHHVARFASRQNVDPTDSDVFTRPVRLHRRDPRMKPGVADGFKDEDDDGLPTEERERRDREKTEREAQREADAAQIAPSAEKGPAQRKIPFGKKVQTVYRNDQTEEQKARSKLKYEETLPWHLEDFDNKSIWVGSYEEALSGQYIALNYDGGVFRIIPLEKWYKFNQKKNKIKTYSLEEAEKKMDAKPKEAVWTKQTQERKLRDEKEGLHKRIAKGLFVVGKTEDMDRKDDNMNFKAEHGEVDELDFEEDRFADDEETPYMEAAKDAEEKEAETRIKLDQLQANAFDMRDEKEYEEQSEEERKANAQLKQFGKRVKKTIVKREKNYIYESDSGQDPYSESSESEDTEAELAKAEERKKEEAKAANASDREKAKTPKISSGASSRGTNTPSGRASKNPLPPTKPSSSLKRPGSPNMSEASGNESSRKKHKKNGFAASQPPQPPSRPMSPNLAPPSSSAPAVGSKRPRSNAGSGSEGEAAGSGGEMSDNTRRRVKLKLSQPSANGTPQLSRAGSPSAPPARTGTPATESAVLPLPTAEELRSKIPPQGISVTKLVAIYKTQVVDDERKKAFTKLMKDNSRYDKESKLLKPV
ncbi:MAG: hypothetical protein Q9191_000530 [Dirinaria sp. TL-2023a]